ncbi:MAG TPA: hypothetical protein VM537_10530 [Anaerolineae bacterium]|nr:hypothetical protein [Anaerolineae bacterium]
MREFETGATRDSEDGKHDYEGFLSPLVIERFGQYMHKHRKQADGELRDSDNWQKGIPQDAYIKSAWRHFLDWWMEHRGHESREGVEEAICALIFNAQGYLHELLSCSAGTAFTGYNPPPPQEVEAVLEAHSTCLCATPPTAEAVCVDCLEGVEGL